MSIYNKQTFVQDLKSVNTVLKQLRICIDYIDKFIDLVNKMEYDITTINAVGDKVDEFTQQLNQMDTLLNQINENYITIDDIPTYKVHNITITGTNFKINFNIINKSSETFDTYDKIFDYVYNNFNVAYNYLVATGYDIHGTIIGLYYADGSFYIICNNGLSYSFTNTNITNIVDNVITIE